MRGVMPVTSLQSTVAKLGSATNMCVCTGGGGVKKSAMHAAGTAQAKKETNAVGPDRHASFCIVLTWSCITA
eukprot:CAMPEP_0119477528 /NCGR_PEP_ID=MMETSP1344-20130328/7635_1 /TAXON_ID=236787 /ORGANISM="Florenciella parvula, Strain CCMP2471" /LENGTH=71 /DNA_ID=CAMNT_0007511535 /DNA_START=37 /DNA_END=253 /DNA_ORIENTATION=-